MDDDIKPLHWIGDSNRELKKFPKAVRFDVGAALNLAQRGEKDDDAKPLKGHKGAGVLEVVCNYEGNTYRAVYTVRFDDGVYVLHAFQKRSTQGIKTSKRDLEKIDSRLLLAQQDYESRKKATSKGGKS